MEKKERRNWSEISKSLNEQEITELSKNAVECYVNSTSQHPSEEACEKYNLSRTCFYRLRNYAIEHNTVSQKTIKAAIKKGHENQDKHARWARQKKEKQERKEDEVKKKEREERQKKEKNFVEAYAENTGLSKDNIAEGFGYSKEEANTIILYCFVNNKVNDDYARKIEKRSIEYADPKQKENTKKTFELLWEIRKINQQRDTL